MIKVPESSFSENNCYSTHDENFTVEKHYGYNSLKAKGSIPADYAEYFIKEST